MQKLVLATHNQGKINEFRWLLRHASIELLASADFESMPEVVEDGATFSQNAIKKAVETATFTGYPALADDSGLVVDALEGAPGVYSARYAGEQATDSANNEKLLHTMRDIPAAQRTARFISAIALAFPDGRIHVKTGTCEGVITFCLCGQGGFGYDPLFYVPELQKTYAEMSNTEKNSCSHRSKALKKMVTLIENIFIKA